jgi:hypothetical protein
MPVRKQKPKFAPDAIVECIESHAAQPPDHVGGVVLEGTRLRGDNPFVPLNEWVEGIDAKGAGEHDGESARPRRRAIPRHTARRAALDPCSRGPRNRSASTRNRVSEEALVRRPC